MRMIWQFLRFSVILCISFVGFCATTLPARAQSEVTKPVIAWMDQDSNLVTGDEVAFRDPETLKKILGGLRLNLPHTIPEIGIRPEALKAAKGFANKLQKKIDAERAADRQAEERKPEADKDPGYTGRAEFRRLVSNWAFEISQLAMNDTEILDQINSSVEVDDKGKLSLYAWRLRNAAMLAVGTDIDPKVFLDKANLYRSQGEQQIALAYYFSGALAGSGPALEGLVELMSEDLTYIPSSEYIQLLAIMRPVGTMELMHRFLDHYTDEIESIRSNSEKPHLFYREAMGVILAVSYVSAYGSDLDRKQLAGMPITNALLWNSLFWALTENAGDIYDKMNPDNEFFPGYCLSLIYQGQEEADELINQYIEHGVRARFSPEQIDQYSYLGVEMFFDKNLSRCTANTRMANDVWDIHDSDYASDLFWVKQVGAYAKSATALQSEEADRGQLAFVDYFDEKFLAASTNGAGEVSPATELLQMYLSLTENVHRFNDYEYSVGRAERRAVYRAVKESPAISLGAIVDVIPRFNDGKLQVGIKVDATFGMGPSAGLAVMIGGHDKTMQAYMENSGLTLIENVLLEKEGVQTLLVHLRTTAGGTHIFEAQDADPDAFTGLLGVQMKAFDEIWDLNFSLAHSQYALRHRLRSISQEQIQ